MATPVTQPVRLDPLGSVGAASFQYAITSATTITFTHGFAARPRHAALFIVCVTAELGFAAGDKVFIGANASVSLMVNQQFATIAPVTLPSVVDPATNTASAITAANWNWFVTLED